ncbi:MAG TPA: hypothetical protein VK158_06350 [Acidobacteriota bacterium]|nr:hypothetical protein [Acidobacteriota bacterium]
MNALEERIITAFRMVKHDIAQLQESVADLKRKNEKLSSEFDKAKVREAKLLLVVRDLRSKVKSQPAKAKKR